MELLILHVLSALPATLLALATLIKVIRTHRIVNARYEKLLAHVAELEAEIARLEGGNER